MNADWNRFFDCLGNNPDRIVVSNPRKKSKEYKKIVIRKLEKEYIAEKYTEKQVFHDKIAFGNLPAYLEWMPEAVYKQADIWEKEEYHSILIGKDGNLHWKTKKEQGASVMIPKTQDRKKQYIIPEGTVIAPLVDMGIFTAEGKVVRTMNDKFKQINRFIEMLDDAIKKLPADRLVNIIDFGCGKSYLTFIVYYYFKEVRKQPVNMVGLDLKEDVIKNCNAAAKKYGYENLHFEVGDIHGYKADFPVDVVMTLHACDTATDFALFNAIAWDAKVILSVPCCQHELNKQMKTDDLSILTRYGIVQERAAALLTDSVRANLLSCCGYKTQILEFVDLSHTPKNLLIRAVKTKMPEQVKKQYLEEAERALSVFSAEQTLHKMLGRAGKLPK